MAKRKRLPGSQDTEFIGEVYVFTDRPRKPGDPKSVPGERIGKPPNPYFQGGVRRRTAYNQYGRTEIRPPERLMNNPFWLRRFSVADYHKMIELGILGANDRVELLEGWIVEKMPQNPPHSGSVRRVQRRVARVLPVDWTMSIQSPITLSESEPEPDISLARGEEAIYDKRHPNPSDIGVLMEVGDATLLEDRRYKGALYAQEKIAEFWLINVVERKIEVYTKPRGGIYQKKTDYTAKQSVPLVLDGLKIAEIPVGELIAKS